MSDALNSSLPDSPLDVAVIGGGIMGLGIAWRAASRGARVAVFDAGPLAREASWAAGGMLAPYAEMEFDEDALLALGEASQQQWPAFVEALEAAAGQSVHYDVTGTLLVSVDRDEAEALRRVFAYQRERGVAVQWLSGDACREREPLLSPYVHSGIHCPGDHNVDNRAVLDALVQACARAGVACYPNHPVKDVCVEAGTCSGLRLDDGREVTARHVVLAAGAWSGRIGGLALRPPVRPVKGQMLALGYLDGPPLAHVVRSTEVYLVPKRDRLVVGATSEERGFDRSQTAGGVYELLRRLYDVLPVMYELPLCETWVGFRPGSRDNGPMLGPTDVAGLHLATGHYRNGIQQAPASIAGVVAGLFGERIPDVIQPFALARFQRTRSALGSHEA